jgi:eukaryotic-like serine/threonine-protein kinase
MGVVYDAEDAVLARTVAIKTIDLSFAAGAGAGSEFEQRFFTEARVAARLSHPGIVVCHDFGKDPASGKLFIVFEYLKGRTLAARAAEGPMEWRSAIEVVVQVARAIHHAHGHGVVHRDLKPANIMLLDPGPSGASAARAQAAVKIMDFGVARLESLGERLTKTGQSFGSPLYMSPEQALGQASTARSDIFSLASVLCTLLLGRPWFDAPSLPEIVGRVIHDDPPRLSRLRPEVPASLDTVLARALAKSEDERYASAADMADDLEDVLAGRAPRRAAGAVSTLPAHDPLASLLDESPVRGTPARPEAAATTPMPTSAPPARVSAPAPVTTGSGRRWLVPAVSMLSLAVLAAGAFVSWRRSPGLEPTLPPSVPVVADRAPTPAADREPAAPAPSASTATALIAPSTRPRPTATSPLPIVRPSIRAAGTPAPITASPAKVPDAAGNAAATSANEAATGSRLRLTVEHPFEIGRLIVWIDGVLVHETKLQAAGSKRIVAFRVREGRAEKLLEVEPGPHEVRVEVTWDQGRRVATKVVDVAPRSTGLLEVRVGRVSKDLSLAWSRLTKE